jgi:hypothetical protein
VTKRYQILFGVLLALAIAGSSSAQVVAVAAPPVIPLDLEVVISRYQGEKKVGSLPYSLSVNASERGEGTRLRMGASVPVPATVDGKAAGPGVATPFNYREIGTSIDVSGKPLADGRFTIMISVSESSVVENPKDTVTNGAPVIRTFSSSNNLVMRDGQTRQFTAASDRITGEVVRVDVTVKVVK